MTGTKSYVFFTRKRETRLRKNGNAYFHLTNYYLIDGKKQSTWVREKVRVFIIIVMFTVTFQLENQRGWDLLLYSTALEENSLSEIIAVLAAESRSTHIIPLDGHYLAGKQNLRWLVLQLGIIVTWVHTQL